MALVVRLVLAWVFLGSVDTVNTISAMPVALRHGVVYIPYFPLITNWLNLAAVIDVHWLKWAHDLGLRPWALPVAFVPKLLPCLADSMLAAWLSMDRGQSVRNRRLAAWTYATCPLPLIIVCLQGQWDSVWVFFVILAIAIASGERTTAKARAIAGVLLGLGVLVKPVPLIMLPLLFSPFGKRVSISTWIRELLPTVLAFLGVVLVAFSWFALEGINLSKNVHGVIRYSTDPKLSLFGISRLQLLNHFGNSTTGLRDLSILVGAVLILRFHLSHHPLDPMITAAALLLITPALGGIAPQYLLWPLPFLLATGRLRVTAVYGALSSLVVLAFFIVPRASHIVGENNDLFLPIRRLGFLAIPTGVRNWLATGAPVKLWHPVGNFILPVAMLALAVFVLRQELHWRGSATIPLHPKAQRDSWRLASILAVVVIVMGIVYELGPYRADSRDLSNHLVDLLHAYPFIRPPILQPFPGHLIGAFQAGSPWLSALTWFGALIAVWSIITWRALRKAG